LDSSVLSSDLLWAEIVSRLQKGIWNLLYLLRLWGTFASAGIDVLFEYLASYWFHLHLPSRLAPHSSKLMLVGHHVASRKCFKTFCWLGSNYVVLASQWSCNWCSKSVAYSFSKWHDLVSKTSVGQVHPNTREDFWNLTRNKLY
jgi:hypothetical protein